MDNKQGWILARSVEHFDENCFKKTSPDTHHDSVFHQLLLVAEHGHPEVTQLFVQKPALLLPQLPLAVDDTCLEKKMNFF